MGKKVAKFLLERGGPDGMAFRAVADIRKQNGDPVRRMVSPWVRTEEAAHAQAKALRDQLCSPT